MPLMPNAIITQVDSKPDGWVDDTNNVWTYVSAESFSVNLDQTIKFSKGTRLKLTQGTVKYFVVVGSSFGGGITTVTITGGTDYTFANSAVSANYYSYAANPQGYPGWFNYTPTWGGFSADPSNLVCIFNVLGNICTCQIYAGTGGTSNVTTFTATLPVTPDATRGYSTWYGRAQNNGTYGTGPGMVITTGNVITADFYRDLAGAAWTASGTKNFQVQGSYLI